MADPKQGQEPQPPVVVDGPAATTPEPAQPKYVPIKFKDREVQAPEDVAQAWEEREREYARKFSERSDELGQLRKWKQQVESTIQPEREKTPDINTLWFENPAEAAKLIQEQTYQRVASEYEKREKVRAQQEALDRFFDGFYRKHDDLREDDWVVKGVMQEHFEELADLPTAKAQERLGDLTRERIIRLTRKVKVSEPDNPRSRAGLSEPATGNRVARPARDEDEDEGPKSIGEAIRARAEARRKAGTRTAARG